MQNEDKLLERITVNPDIFGGKPIIRGRRLAVEHVLGMLAAGDTPEIVLRGYPWLEPKTVSLVTDPVTGQKRRISLRDLDRRAQFARRYRADRSLEFACTAYPVRVGSFDRDHARRH